MKGIQFLVDEQGNAKSVVLDLEEWGDLWEDFYDGILAQNALNEGPMIPWETLKAELDAELEQGEEWQVSLVDGRWIFHSVLISVSKRTETIIRQIKRRIRPS